jgi:hypothetical protein
MAIARYEMSPINVPDDVSSKHCLATFFDEDGGEYFERAEVSYYPNGKGRIIWGADRREYQATDCWDIVNQFIDDI